eukprot:403350553
MPLTMQLQDLRSQITKEASKGISLMAQILQQDFEPLAHKFISKNSLYKLLNAAKHVLAEHSHICIIAILNNVICPKIIPNIHEEIKSKNPTVRIHNAEYLYLILSMFPVESYGNYLSLIEDMLISLIQDAKSEARQLARMAFFRYKQICNSDRTDYIFNSVDAQNQKAILDEEDLFPKSDYIPSKTRYTEKNNMRSPSKFDSLNNQSLGGGQGYLTLPGGLKDLKQTRSVSRGRPSTASNNLVQKANGMSPSGGHKKQMKSPDPEDRHRENLANLIIHKQESLPDPLTQQAKDDLENQGTGESVTSPKLDVSKLKLLKSPRVIAQQKDLKIQTSSIIHSNSLQMDQMEQKSIQPLLLEVKKVSMEEKKQQSLASPRLPAEKQRQLQNLREKKQKQLEDSQKDQSVNQLSINTQNSEKQQLSTSNPNKFLVKNQENIDKLKRQKSASPRQNSPKSALIKKREPVQKPQNIVISQKQQQPKHNFNTLPVNEQKHSVISTSHNDESLSNKQYQSIPNQRHHESTLSTSFKVKQQTSTSTNQSQQQVRMQVSHSIQSAQAKIEKKKQESFEQQTASALNQLNSSDEQKIFEELDFLNQNDSIESLVVSASSSHWKERLRSFQVIRNSEDQLQECSDQLLKKLFKVHVDFLQDKNENVIVAVQDSLLILIQYKPSLVDKYLDQIIPMLLQNMVNHNEQISIQSSDIINVICLQQNASDIVLILMDLLKENISNPVIATAALEVLVVLLKDDQEYCQKNANVLETTLKIVELLQHNINNMDVIMPSIAVLLAMRDKNFEGLMRALIFLKSQQLQAIVRLSLQFAPDFENDIKRYVISDQSQFKKQTNTQQNSVVSQKKTQMNHPPVTTKTSMQHQRQDQSKLLSNKNSNNSDFMKGSLLEQQTRNSKMSKLTSEKYPQVSRGPSNDDYLNQLDNLSVSQRSFESQSIRDSQHNDTFNSNNIDLHSHQILQSEENLKESTIDIEKASPVNILQQNQNFDRFSKDLMLKKPYQENSYQKTLTEVFSEGTHTYPNYEEDEKLEEVIENFADHIVLTQSSQKNYVMSKPGDTEEDQIEDGVSPTPKNSNIQQKIDKSQEVQEFLLIMKNSTPNNRQKLFDRLDEFFVMGDPTQIIDILFEDLVNQMFEILKDEDTQQSKEQAINQLQKLLRSKHEAVTNMLEHVIEDIAVSYYTNKKVSIFYSIQYPFLDDPNN